MRGVATEEDLQLAGLGGPANKGDEALWVQFYMGVLQNEQRSMAEGRPIFEDVPYVKIVTPGDKDNIVDRPARIGTAPYSDNVRFARQWAAFKAGAEDVQSGTPLSAWPAITRAQVEELAHFGIKTVEALAAVSDANAQKFMGNVGLRQRAKDFLEAAKGSAHLEKMRAELADRDNKIETLQRQLEAQVARIDALQAKAGEAEAHKRK